MSKIQGKQIAESTITQGLLNLSTPTSGDTLSGATVQYVNERLTGGVALTIGPAEDVEGYVDGIFTDFNTGTTVGTAVDRFNEMFKLLAPTPPSGNWTGAFGATLPTLSTGTLANTPRMIGTSTPTSNVIASTQTPSFTISSSVGTEANARTKDGTFVFTIKDYNGTTIESATIYSGSTSKTSGILRYTIADPYVGQSGKAGFWTGVTAFSATSFSTGTIARGTTGRQLTFEHPTGQNKSSVTFYIDETNHTPVVGGLTIGTLPSMTRFVSGVPSANGGATIPITSFSITDVSTYFYSNTGAYNVTGNVITTASNQAFDTIPSTLGEDQTFSNKSAVITTNGSYVEAVTVTITPQNRIGGNGTAQTKTLNNATDGYLRIDTSSDESSRLTSGSGNYPANGTYGSAWGANSGTSLQILTNELQMLSNVYRYPSGDYTNFGGPNYNSPAMTGIKWVTFNLGTFSNNNAFTLNFNSTNITSIGQAGLYVEVRIGTATSWVNGNAAYSGLIPNPGSTVTNGDPAVAIGFPSTATVRRIVFGTPTYSGNIIVRVGLAQGSSITITSLSATALV
jgi:hypothetical protein